MSLHLPISFVPMGLQTLIVLSSTLSVFDINICKKNKEYYVYTSDFETENL